MTKSKVAHLSEEVKFIKKFVGLHGKKKSPQSILNLVKALQKAIVQKLITKNSPFAPEIKIVQDSLVRLYNNMKTEKVIRLEEKSLPRLAAIAGGEEVLPSIAFIKSFIGLQGKELDLKRRDLFIKRLENAARSGKLTRDDPFIDRINKIYSFLKFYKGKKKVHIQEAELNGLKCICKGYNKALGRIYDTQGKSLRRCRSKRYSDAGKGACSYNKGLENLGKIYDSKGKALRRCRSRKYSDAKRGACSYNGGLEGVMTARQVANMQFELVPFQGKWQNLIGRREKNFTMLVHGEPGAGKSTFLIQFAKYLTSFGDVAYISSEEFGSVTLQNLVTKYLNPLPANMVFSSNPNALDLSKYDFVIFDSVNDIGLQLEDFKTLRQENPDTAFVLVLQHRKDGAFKGGKEWEHEVQIAGEITNGTINIYKNRYATKGSMDFFN